MANKFIEVLSVALAATYLWLSLLIIPVLPLIIYFCPYSVAVIISYIAWRAYEISTGCTIVRKMKWVGKLFLWKYGRDYFPARLFKTADLPEGQNYILAAHPHAILPISHLNLFTEANNVSELFPGIDFRGASRLIIDIPLLREILLSLGFFIASESNITHLLQRNTSTGILISPGGSREIPFSEPDSNELKIYASKRKGFVRIALKTGSALVPVVSFGDTEVLSRMRIGSTRLLNFIPFIRTAFPDGLPMFNLMPRRFPLYTIDTGSQTERFFDRKLSFCTCTLLCLVGEPMTVPKIENPSSELIDEYHARFYDAFRQLFEKYKQDYSPKGRSYKLIIV